MTDHLPFAKKVAHNIGLIVLESQEFERNLKLLVAATEVGGDSSILERHKLLERRSLGEVVKRFWRNVTVTEGNPEDVKAYFKHLLDRRNKVVHHFFETYAEDLNASRHAEILGNLAQLHTELRAASASFRSANQEFLDALQDEQPLAS